MLFSAMGSDAMRYAFKHMKQQARMSDTTIQFTVPPERLDSPLPIFVWFKVRCQISNCDESRTYLQSFDVRNMGQITEIVYDSK